MNDHVRPCNLKPQQRDLTPVLRRPVEPAPQNQTFQIQHYANHECRRQIGKSPLAQIEMSLSTVSVGEHWAHDGDYDEPDGDRPDERVAGSGSEQDQGDGSRDADEPWSASGVPTGQGLRSAGPGGLGFPEARSGRAIAAILRIY